MQTSMAFTFKLGGKEGTAPLSLITALLCHGIADTLSTYEYPF